MKKVFCLMLALCMLALIPVATAEVYSERELSLLTVTGEAQVLLAADSAVMNLGVTTKAATVAEASATNATTLDAVINALHDAGVDAADIVTQDYSVSPVYDYQYGKLGDGEVISAYQVSNQLKVTVSNVNELGTVLDAAMKAGANEAYGITFQSSQTAEAKDKALTAAIAEAARKAEMMAKASGKKLGDLVALTEEPYGTSSGVTLKYESAADMGTTILADSLTVTAQVTAVYTME